MVDNYDEQQKQEQAAKRMSPMGATGIIVAWLAFRMRIRPETLVVCIQSIQEMLARANERAYQLGWCEEPEDWGEPGVDD